MAPSLYGYQLLVIDETRGYRVDTFGPPQDKQLVRIISSIMMLSPVSPVILVLAISADVVSNPIITTDNTVVAITRIVAQLVCKISAPIIAKPKLSDVQPHFHVTAANAPFMERAVSRNTSASLTREKVWTPSMSACVPTSENVPPAARI